MDDVVPRPPDVPRKAVDALIAHAEQCAAFVAEEHRQARLRGHVVSGQSIANLQGYRFTALFLRESYDGSSRRPYRPAMDDEPAADAATERALAELQDMVAAHGVAVRMVAGPDPGSDEGAVAYTVGLSLRDHPELLCTGLPQDSAHALLDHLGRRVVEDGLALEPGRALDAGHPDGTPGLPVAVIPVEDDGDLVAVEQLYGARRALQVVWTDSTGRFPWHDGYANDSSLQPLRGPVAEELLLLPCPDVPPSRAAADRRDLVVTTQAVVDGAAVTVVQHTADGGWQLLDGDVTEESVAVAVHVHELVATDHSLAVALTIPAGSRATREGAGQDWVQWPLGSA